MLLLPSTSIAICVILLMEIEAITLRVGNIGSKEMAGILGDIVAMAKKKMIEENIIDKDFDIEVMNVEGCGNSFDGVAAAAKLYHLEKIDAFFGPYCTQELSPVAAMASYWNIPIFAYTGTSPIFSNSKVYKTLIRTSFQAITSISDATASFIAAQNWTKVVVVSNIGADSFDKVQTLEIFLRKRGIQITRRVLFEEYSTASDLINSGMMAEIKGNARVVIPLFSSERDLQSVFRNATIMADMTSSDYIYVYPMMVSRGNEPPVYYGKSDVARMKTTYQNSIQIYNSFGYQEGLLSAFLAIFDKRVYIDERNLFNFVSLYESFIVFAKTAKKLLSFTGRTKNENQTRSLDGKAFWSMLRGKTFDGIAGPIQLDSASERAENFHAVYIDTRADQIRMVADMNSTITASCDDVVCVETKVDETMTKYWHSENGRFPDSDPLCGFRNEKCDYTQIIAIVTAVVCILVVILGIIWMRRICESKSLEKMPWRIFRDHVQLLDEEQVKSVVSLTSGTSTKMSQVEAKLIKNHAIVGVNTHAVYDVFEQRQRIRFNREDLILLTKMKQAVHDNINPFIGIAFNEKNELLLLWKFCSRGTLQDVIYSDKFVMDEKFHGAFVRDITMGLEYLHSSPIGFHGSLSTWSTLIDKNWMIKLSDYAVSDPLKRWEKHGSINCKVDNESEKRWQKLATLYIPPEMRLANENNRRGQMGAKWKEQTCEKKKRADIYAFGMIIYEILFKSLPYDEKVDLTELANKAAEGEKITRPSVQRNRKLNPDMVALLQDCWSDLPDQRPTIRRVRLSTEIALQTKGNLVDSMMRMMEEYANNLEKLVGERTKLAEEANLRAERLLFQLLPKNIAVELKAGRSVPPRLYSSATVMFSDIVGFTKLCSVSSPIEVVNLLNLLYSEFDQVINKHNSYKVETIGDAYMVVSGVPEENGRRHVANISSITIDIVSLLKNFEIPHKRGDRLAIRLGFASGPVAAAVIGLNAPRYCLFGETVNSASIMESSGEGGRIQMSESSKILLEEEYPEYSYEVRGINKKMTEENFVTYWLTGKDDDYFKNKQF